MADTVIDPTVDTQVYLKQGGGELVIGPTGVLNILTGGKILPAGGAQPATTPVITDSTGGTGSTTFAAIAAGVAYTQADAVAIKNALSEIATTLNGIGVVLKGAGLTA